MSFFMLFRNSAVLGAVLLFAGCGGGGDSPVPSGVSAESESSADPLYSAQWHLKNTGQAGGAVGEDVNAEAAWASVKGNNVTIAVVDDGMDIHHEALAPNVVPGSYNYLDKGTDPTANSDHGTQVAGLAAARDLNSVGVRGVAPRANLVSYNLLQSGTASDAADAATRGLVDVNTNSWGPSDDGKLHAPGILWYTAIDYGLASGRGGLGTVYTWAAGNGASIKDNSNFDGYANHRGVMAIGAVTDKGVKAPYSEPGANIWVSAPAGDYCSSGHTLTTTDMTGTAGMNSSGTHDFYGPIDYSNSNYTKCMNGTSGATPIVAGTAALMLSANPGLAWRDVKLILAETARKNDAASPGWINNGAGFHVHHDYGFGVVDAGAAVAAAKTWTNVGTLLTCTSGAKTIDAPIPDSPTTGTPGATVRDDIVVTDCPITKLEYVEITFNATHTYSGDLVVWIQAPTTTQSVLAEQHFCDTCSAYSDWVFGSARHLGEAVNGTWTLMVADGYPADVGTVLSWSLKFYGRAE